MLKHASKKLYLETALLTDILEYCQSNTFLVTGKRIIISLIFPRCHYVLSSSSVFSFFFFVGRVPFRGDFCSTNHLHGQQTCVGYVSAGRGQCSLQIQPPLIFLVNCGIVPAIKVVCNLNFCNCLLFHYY